VLGVIENMSYYLCRKCGHRHEIFAHGGGARFANELDVPFLGEIPMVRQIREGGDTANPIVAVDPGHPVSATFKSIAAVIIARLAGSTARPQA
jgi:ATP-binding protein involved in chromosome partitioning